MTCKMPHIFNRLRRVATILAAILCGTMCISAQNDTIPEIVRPVNSVFSINMGSASVLDTYLTPIRYHGTSLGLGYERLRAIKKSPEKWVTRFTVNADYDDVTNIVGSHNMYSAMVGMSWSAMRRWTPIPKLQVGVGAGVSADGGAIYNALNSNNVVSVKIHASINPTAMAAYNTSLFKVPITLRYQTTMSMLGVFFSPQYGEAYYEIYVGNHSGLVHFGWWGNRFDMENNLTADIHLGGTILRVGYRGTIQTSWVCNLNTQIFRNCFTIGVGGDWISVSSKRKANSTCQKIISALY